MSSKEAVVLPRLLTFLRFQRGSERSSETDESSTSMAEDGPEEGEIPKASQPPQFLEVACMSSGKVRRFAAGTEAGFALHLINCKLDIGQPAALFVEAVKEGEEPVSFGPNAVLVNYGKDWKLQTVTKEGYEEATEIQRTLKPFPKKMKPSDLQSMKRPNNGTTQTIDFLYIGKIVVAFIFIFLLGGTLTLLLENLPRLISFIT